MMNKNSSSYLNKTQIDEQKKSSSHLKQNKKKQMNKNQFITLKKNLFHKKTNKTDWTASINSKSEQVCSQDLEDTTKKKFN